MCITEYFEGARGWRQAMIEFWPSQTSLLIVAKGKVEGEVLDLGPATTPTPPGATRKARKRSDVLHGYAHICFTLI